MDMLTAAQPEPETVHAAPDGAAAPCGTADPRPDEALASVAGLSNDYLNHYSEVLMLIEMAREDPAVAVDLGEWAPASYRSYFGASALRRASAALSAYDALPEDRRRAFEKLVANMDALATLAVFALQSPYKLEAAAVIVETTAPALRALIARAGAFLNSGGQELADDKETEEAQLVIDRLLEQAGQRAET